MALRLLIKSGFLMAFVTLHLPGFAASDFSCRQTEVKSMSIEASEKTNLCFMKDNTYFISKNCQDLNCSFMDDLRQHKLTHASDERPGAMICKAIKGTVEDVKLSGSRITMQRCLFTVDKSFISLNLLESWDGKKFSGPSRPLDI